MRINGNAISPWQREYVRNNQPVKQDDQTEGVRFERSVQEAQKSGKSTPKVRAPGENEKTLPTESTSELLSLLSSEERHTLARLFPDKGPDWGVAAYRRTVGQKSENPEGGVPGHVDLVG